MEYHMSLIMNKLELHISTWMNFISTKSQTKLCCRIYILSSHLHKVQNKKILHTVWGCLYLNIFKYLYLNYIIIKYLYFKNNLKCMAWWTPISGW